MSARFWCAFVAAFLAVTAAANRPSQAGCGLPPVFAFAPEGGSELPLNPTIWVFVRDRFGQPRAPIDELTVTDGRGLPLRAVRTPVATEGAYRAVQLQIASPGGSVIVHGRTGKERVTARYELRRAPRRADPEPATEIVAAKYVYASGCPSANGFILSIEPRAPAYRVELEGHTWIVPNQEDASDSRRYGTIVTGGVYCWDFNIPTDKPLALQVTPLLPDGRIAMSRSPYGVVSGPPTRCTTHGRVTHCTSQLGLFGGLSWELSGPVRAISLIGK
jgi:hypothetical protein